MLPHRHGLVGFPVWNRSSDKTVVEGTVFPTVIQRREECIMSGRQYKHECCRCGLCCLTATCLVGRVAFGIEAGDPCPALAFDGDESRCKVAANEQMRFAIGIGTGCDIKARMITMDNVVHPFDAQPPEDKRHYARQFKAIVERHGRNIGTGNGAVLERRAT